MSECSGAACLDLFLELTDVEFHPDLEYVVTVTRVGECNYDQSQQYRPGNIVTGSSVHNQGIVTLMYVTFEEAALLYIPL